MQFILRDALIVVLWCYGATVLRRDAVLRCYDVDALICCVLNGSPPMGTPRRAEATRRRRGCGTTLRLKISELLNRLPLCTRELREQATLDTHLKISELLNRLPPNHHTKNLLDLLHYPSYTMLPPSNRSYHENGKIHPVRIRLH